MASRRSSLALLALLLPLGCSPARERPPNLVFVLVDTLRADHLGYHGYGRPTSPFLDSLASESVVFLDHHSHASRTEPSVASLFTGLHPQSHGVVNPLDVRDGQGTLAPEQVTLAEVLRAAGYACYGLVGNPNVNARWGFDQGFELYERVKPARASDLTARALEVLALRREPFFLYLHYMDPHSAYAPRPPHAGLFADARHAGRVTGDTDQLNAIVAGELVLDAAELAQLIALYDEEVRAFDAGLEQLVATLRAEGTWDDTLLVVVADHGEELLDHGSALHGYTLYEEQLRVPLLVRDPRSGARRIEGVTRHVDVLPTLLELLGLAAPSVQGVSLAPLVRGDVHAPDELPVYAQATLNAVKTVALESYAAGGWKLVRHALPAPRRELYDLAHDPLETHDLAAQRADVLRALEAELDAFRAALPTAAERNLSLTPEELEELRGLGYVR